MPVVSVNGARFNVMQTRAPRGACLGDLVLCHGLASSLGFWLQDYVDALSPHFRLTLFDMRGHGRSSLEKAGYHPADLAADLAGICAALGIERPHVMAHSFGGVAALRWAVEAPGALSSLVVLDTHICLGRALGHRRRSDPRLGEALGAAGLAVDAGDPFFGLALLTALARKRLDEGSEAAAEAGAAAPADPRLGFLMARMSPGTAARWLALIEETEAEAGFTAQDGISRRGLGRFEAPLLALYGGKSQALPSGRVLAKSCAGARLHVFAGSGHFFALTRAREVVQECLAFWSLPALDDAVLRTQRVA